MSVIQLVRISGGVAMVSQDGGEAMEITWPTLQSQQSRSDATGAVCRWLMEEYRRCDELGRQARAWYSPPKDVGEICDEMSQQDPAVEARDREDLRRAREAEQRRIETERRDTPSIDPWWPIASWDVPDSLRFDVPGRNQGQIVEVAYGTYDHGEACSSDPYMRVHDQSDQSVRYYRRRPVE